LEDVLDFFRETLECFTIYVVEQRFVVGRGLEYFKQFKGTPNYIHTDKMICKRILTITSWLNKKIPNVSELVKNCFSCTTPIGLIEVINSLSKIFTSHEHQAVGPEVLDPIIIQESKIDKKYVTRMITLHEKSFLQPVIIILLKDNDFNRAKAFLTDCPHNMNVKFIRNSGETELHRIINAGANDIDSFLDSFALQCFSTCSRTSRKILTNQEWSENSIIKKYSPNILKFRANLLLDEKNEIRSDLSEIVNEIECQRGISTKDETLLRSLECMTKLFRVYCNDGGNRDICDALELAKDLNNDLLLAHVYRYAFFLPKISLKDKRDLLSKAEAIFTENNIADHAIYCKNNILVDQLSTDKINVRDFTKMNEEALHNVPGIVGMSHILNNTGVAHILTGNPEGAMYYLNRGVEYACNQEQSVQRLGLLCNQLITKSYCYEKIDQNEIRKVINQIFDNMGMDILPFIGARYIINLLTLAYNQSISFGEDILNDYPILEIVQKGFNSNSLGSGQLLLQLSYLENKFDKIDILGHCKMPRKILEVAGRRKYFIEKYGYNPFAFNTWL